MILCIYIEPAPYILALMRRVRALVGDDAVRVVYVAKSVTQQWSQEIARNDIVLPESRLRAFAHVARLIADSRVTGVHLAGWGHPTLLWSLLLSRVLRKAVTLESDSQDLASERDVKRFVKNFIYGLLFRLPAGFLPGGTRQSQYLARFGVGPSRRLVAQMTVDVTEIQSLASKVDRAEFRRSLGISESEFVVAFVGRLEPHKGVCEVLEAFRDERLSKNAKLLIAGSGSLDGRLQEACNLMPNIRLLGQLGLERIVAVFASADLAIVPSKFEPWGLVVNEALACGLPVVATRAVGCVPDLIVHDENGFVIDSCDASLIADAVMKAKEVGARNGEMRRASLAKISNWTMERSAELTVEGWRRFGLL